MNFNNDINQKPIQLTNDSNIENYFGMHTSHYGESVLVGEIDGKSVLFSRYDIGDRGSEYGYRLSLLIQQGETQQQGKTLDCFQANVWYSQDDRVKSFEMKIGNRPSNDDNRTWVPSIQRNTRFSTINSDSNRNDIAFSIDEIAIYDFVYPYVDSFKWNEDSNNDYNYKNYKNKVFPEGTFLENKPVTQKAQNLASQFTHRYLALNFDSALRDFESLRASGKTEVELDDSKSKLLRGLSEFMEAVNVAYRGQEYTIIQDGKNNVKPKVEGPEL